MKARKDLSTAEGAKTIDVALLGRTYRIACNDGEREDLLRAVAYLDGKMSEIRKAGKVTGTERIAVMAALNITNELLRTKGRDDSLETDVTDRLRSLRERVESALANGQQLEL